MIPSETLNSLSKIIQAALGINSALQGKVFSSVLIIFSLWILRNIAFGIISKRKEFENNIRPRYKLKKTLTYITFSIGLIIVGRIWFEGIQSLSTFLGLFSAGLAISLKDPLINIAGWVFLVWRKPFAVGDRVEVGDIRGDVIDIRLFQFTVMEIGNWVDSDQSTGRLIHIPNGKVFTEKQANYTQGFNYIWNEIPILLTFESDWKEAKSILTTLIQDHVQTNITEAEKTIKRAAHSFMIFYDKLTPIVYTSVKESGVLLTIRYMCRPHGRRNSEEELWESILDAFHKEPNIDFAYPTQRFYSTSEDNPKQPNG